MSEIFCKACPTPCKLTVEGDKENLGQPMTCPFKDSDTFDGVEPEWEEWS